MTNKPYHEPSVYRAIKLAFLRFKRLRSRPIVIGFSLQTLLLLVAWIAVQCAVVPAMIKRQREIQPTLNQPDGLAILLGLVGSVFLGGISLYAWRKGKLTWFSAILVFTAGMGALQLALMVWLFP